MNRIEITLEAIELPSWLEEYRSFVSRLLAALSIDNWELSILLCDGQMIRRLNAGYRKKDEVTDVLTFPQREPQGEFHGEPDGDEPVLPESREPWPAGDVVIAVDRIASQAEEFGVSFTEELYRMSIHGVLHLMGRHHESTDEEEPMLKFQEELLSRLMGAER